MSLKDPKKIHENDDYAIFQGKDGHELKILKSGLSEKLRKQLAELPLHAAKGAEIKGPEEFEPGKDYSKAPLPGEKPYSGELSKEQAPEKGSDKGQDKSAARKVGELIKERGIGPVVQGVKDFVGAGEKVLETGKEVAKGAGLIPETSIAPQVEVPAVAAPVEEAPPAQEQLAPQVAPAQSPAAPRVVAQQPQQQTPQQLAQTYKVEADQEAAKTYQDLLSGRITPKTYSQLYSDKSTMGKIGTIFGLLLSGAGSGLTKGPNLLLEMMNKEIDRDLEGQKKSVEGAHNFYRIGIEEELKNANITKIEAERLGIWKDIEAKALENAKTRLELTSMAHLMSKANLLPENDRAKAGQALSGLQNIVLIGIDKRNARAAEQRALRALGHLGMVPGAQNIADANDARYVPGVGEAGIEVPESTRKELGAHQKLADSVADLMKYSKSHTNLVPGTPSYNEGVTKALAVQQQVREGMLGTVFRESEKPLLEKFIKENPAGALKMISTQPRLKAILESNRIASNALKKQYDLPTEGAKEEGVKEETVIWRGHKYKRGPKGEPVRID